MPINMRQYHTFSLKELTTEENKALGALILSSMTIAGQLENHQQIIKFNYDLYYKHVYSVPDHGFIIVFNVRQDYLFLEEKLFLKISNVLIENYSEIFEKYTDLVNEVDAKEFEGIKDLIAKILEVEIRD
jgi:hypothetical protein